jgi:hypothetical protein
VISSSSTLGLFVPLDLAQDQAAYQLRGRLPTLLRKHLELVQLSLVELRSNVSVWSGPFL